MPLNIDLRQICLHMLNFTILTAALYFLLYGPVKRFMDERAARYGEMERRAREQLEEAEKVRAERDAALARAGDEARELKAAALQEASDEAREQLERAKAEAAHILAQAKAEAQAERDRAMEQARGELAGLVADAAGKLLARSTSDAYDQFLGAAGGSAADA